jgi:hypothetical protein
MPMKERYCILAAMWCMEEKRNSIRKGAVTELTNGNTIGKIK